MLPTLAILVLALVTLIASPVMVVALWLDKRRAGRGAWRISERTLHTIEACGGWAASIWARRALHHKSRKASYRVVAAGISVMHGLAWAVLLAWRLAAL